MPVGALIGGAVATVGGAAMSSNASKSAAKTQAAASDRAAELEHQRYLDMRGLAMPGYNRAEGAASTYMQALGLSPQRSSGAPATSFVSNPATPQQPQAGPQAVSQRLMTKFYDDTDGGGGAYSQPAPGQPTPSPVGQPVQTPPQQQPPQAAQPDIAAQVMQTPGYQAQLDQGMKSIDRAAPLVGGMYSGRRMKALNDHGQQTFGSYYNDWLNRVGGMAGQAPQIAQSVGQAGMQNAANMGNLWMTGANARAQGSLNSASAWGGALGTIGGMVGGFYGR